MTFNFSDASTVSGGPPPFALCSCGAVMKLVNLKDVYAMNIGSKCEACQANIVANSDCMHCPKGKKKHLIGFDYCLECVQSGYSISNPPPYKVDKHSSFLSDKDVSIILSFWFRILNVNIFNMKIANIPLNVIEYNIIPFLYSKQGFNYNIIIGLFALRNNNNHNQGIYIKDNGSWPSWISNAVIQQYQRDKRDERRIFYNAYTGNTSSDFEKGPYYYHRSYDKWKLNLKSLKNVTIDKHKVDIEFDAVDVSSIHSSFHIKIPSGLSNISDFSIVLILCLNDGVEYIQMIQSIVPKIFASSDDVHIAIFIMDNKDQSGNDVFETIQNIIDNSIDSVIDIESRINVYFGKLFDESFVNNAVNQTISSYIKRLEAIHKAI